MSSDVREVMAGATVEAGLAADRLWGALGGARGNTASDFAIGGGAAELPAEQLKGAEMCTDVSKGDRHRFRPG